METTASSICGSAKTWINCGPRNERQGLLLHLKTVQSFHPGAPQRGTVGGHTAYRMSGMFDFQVKFEEN